jgi:flagellar biosynthesis anti-sigma factor FlgM
VRINPNLGVPDPQSTDRVGVGGTPQAAKPLQTDSQNSGDQTNLSPDATKLSDLSAALSNVPEIRQERVGLVSQALQNGSYSVSNQQIAQSMLHDFRMSSSISQ